MTTASQQAFELARDAISDGEVSLFQELLDFKGLDLKRMIESPWGKSSVATNLLKASLHLNRYDRQAASTIAEMLWKACEKGNIPIDFEHLKKQIDTRKRPADKVFLELQEKKFSQ